MNKEKYLRVPLEKRLERLAAGNASTPQFSRRLIDDFCRTPIVPVLEKCASFRHRKELLNLLKKQYGWEHTDNVSVSFGDIAVMIADLYLSVSARREEKTLKLAAVYFSCFDEIWEAQHRDRDLTRDSIYSILQSVYDFSHVSLRDYNDYSYECGISAVIKERRDEYIMQKGFSTGMSPLQLYTEMKRDALLGVCCFSEHDFLGCDDYDTDCSNFDLAQISHLIDFFVCPIASITNELYRTASETENNNYKGEKTV